jgi:hypothetical protein
VEKEATNLRKVMWTSVDICGLADLCIWKRQPIFSSKAKMPWFTADIGFKDRQT